MKALVKVTCHYYFPLYNIRTDAVMIMVLRMGATLPGCVQAHRISHMGLPAARRVPVVPFCNDEHDVLTMQMLHMLTCTRRHMRTQPAGLQFGHFSQN